MSGDEASSSSGAFPTSSDSNTAPVAAIAATRASSYAFSQELVVEADLLGERTTLSSGVPIATGVSAGDDLMIETDLGGFVRQVMLAEGSSEEELLDPVLTQLASIEMGLWVVGDQVTIDVVDLVNTFGAAVPFQSPGDRGPQASSPVMVNRRSLSNREVAEVDALLQHLVEIGHGEMVTNPIRLLAVLEELTATVEPNTVQRVDEDEEGLTTYRYVVPYTDYGTGLNQNVALRLERSGIDLGFNSRGWPEQMDRAIQEATVEVSVTIDREGLLRRLVTQIDVGTFAKYWTSHDLDVLNNNPFEIVYTTSTTFDQHGQPFTISPPTAVDVSSSFME